MTQRHLAIIEDEVTIARNYRDLLEKHGYKVSLYHDRSSAMEAFRSKLPEMAIIDVGLGNEIEGGFDLCRQLREQAPQLPIIFLTARDSEFDVISGLRLGADDYLTKDISPPHLVARIVALFRRIEALAQPPLPEEMLERDQLSLDMERLNVTWQGQLVDLTLTEFWMLHSLVKHPGHVKNRQQLMDAANTVLDDNTITSHIKRIRKKFVQIDATFNAIKTVYGAGYRWQDDN